MANRTFRRAPFTTSLLALWVGSIALASSSAEGSTCAPVRPGTDPSTLPLPWRSAYQALIASTSVEGLPWSCPGGTVELALPSNKGPFLLSVTDAKGRKTTRPLANPGEVGPTGKALLAAPQIATPGPSDEPVIVSPPAPPPTVVAPPPQKEAPGAAPPTEPRLVIAITGGPRMSGPDATVWMSGGLRGVIPLGPWSLGLWTRFDLPVAMERVISPYFSMSSVSVGLSGGRTFTLGSFAIDALLAPSAAVVSMELAPDENVKHPEGARVAFRLGAELGASARITDWLRARIAVDGEVTPADAALIADGFPHPPRYMLGLSLGLEAVIH
jgi:hypothetical protein